MSDPDAPPSHGELPEIGALLAATLLRGDDDASPLPEAPLPPPATPAFAGFTAPPPPPTPTSPHEPGALDGDPDVPIDEPTARAARPIEYQPMAGARHDEVPSSQAAPGTGTPAEPEPEADTIHLIPPSLDELPFHEGDDDLDEPQSMRRVLFEWGAVIGCAVVVALLIINFGIQAFKIPSESMESTLQIDDRVLVNKLSYDFHDLNRGDVIVFERPPSSKKNNAEDPDDLIKRVIGLPGERISARNGRVYVNDRPLVEPYVSEGVVTDHLDAAVTVPPGSVFVMGDNRGQSYDSRFFGPIDQDLVIGRAFAIVWPPSRAASL